MLINFVHRFRTTIWCAVAALAILAFAYFDLDLIRFGDWFLNTFSTHEIDDEVAATVLLIIGLTVDLRRENKQFKLELQIQAHRLAVLKATMRTVQDLVNNFLNNMQLVQLEAGDALSPETRLLLENATRETFVKLKALGDLDCVPDAKMAIDDAISV